MNLFELIRVTKGPYYISYNAFNADMNRHEKRREVFITKDEIPKNLLTRTVSFIRAKNGNAGLGIKIRL